MTALARRIILWITSLIGLFVGVWAAAIPRSFYDSFPGAGLGPWVAIDGPYNEHLVRDVGALYMGLAAAGLCASFTSGGKVARAVGIAWVVFSIPHLGYHLAHLAGMNEKDAISEIVSLSSTVVLGALLILPDRPRRTSTNTTITKEE